MARGLSTNRLAKDCGPTGLVVATPPCCVVKLASAAL